MRLSYLLAILAIAISDASAQPATGVYITTTAKGDTFAVEHFARLNDRVVGDIRIPSAHQRLSYSLALTDSVLVSWMDAQVRPDTAKETSAPVQSFTMSFKGDSVQVNAAGHVQSLPVKSGSLPWINPSFSLIEQIIRRAHHLDPSRARVDSLPIVDLNSGPVTVAVSWAPHDSALVQFASGSARVAFDRTDHVIGALFPNGTVMRVHQLEH